MVLLLDHLLTAWLVLDREVGLFGGVVSIQNGPRWIAVAFQFQTVSIVRRWKYQSFPLDSVGLVMGRVVPSGLESGKASGEWSQQKE
jgi:hypothetical protein